MALHVGKRIDNAVLLTFEHKHATVIHPHPYVLPLVVDKLSDAVVKQRHLRLAARLIVEEIESVKSRQSVPCAYPYISVVVLDNIGDGIAAQAIVGGVVGLRRVHGLSLGALYGSDD